MTVTLNPEVNGSRQRKSLAGQLDRLDSILDGLDQGLAGAIGDAVKEIVPAVVAQTIRATLIEIATNPDILALLRGSLNTAAASVTKPEDGTTAEQRPAAIRRVGQAVANAWRWCTKKTAAVGRAITTPVRNACTAAITTYRQVNALWRLRRPIIISLGVGAAVGVVVGYVSAPWLAGIVSGVSAMSATLGAQLALWTRRLFGGLSII